MLWNTAYLERAIAALRRHRQIDDDLLAYVAPLGWNHINLTGDLSVAGRQTDRPGPIPTPPPTAAIRAAGLAYKNFRFLRSPLTIRRSKTDREGAGATVAVPLGGEEATCPVEALRCWLKTAAIGKGRVFRRIVRHGNLGPTLSDRTLAEIVAARANNAGLEGDFAGHSLRAGFATAAARVGRSEAAIMRHGRWKSVQIARRYIRQGTRWDDNPAADLGL